MAGDTRIVGRPATTARQKRAAEKAVNPLREAAQRFNQSSPPTEQGKDDADGRARDQ